MGPQYVAPLFPVCVLNVLTRDRLGDQYVGFIMDEVNLENVRVCRTNGLEFGSSLVCPDWSRQGRLPVNLGVG